MEYLGWCDYVDSPAFDYGVKRAIDNYFYNANIELAPENKIDYNESDLVVLQFSQGLARLRFADTTMDHVACEVMATYNAMCFSNGNNDDVDFFKLSAEFEISGIRHNMFAWLPDSILDNSDEAYLVTREGGFGSDPLKIKNCLISYDKQFYEIYVDYKYAFTDASPLKKKHSENCEGLQNMCINGKGTIVSYVFDKVKIHTFAVEYDTGEKLPLTTYNRRNDEEAKMSYGSIEEAIGADRYYLSGYVLF